MLIKNIDFATSEVGKLALPECVSRSVFEVEPPEFILNKDISGPEEGVALLEDVGQHLLLGRFRISVTLS